MGSTPPTSLPILVLVLVFIRVCVVLPVHRAHELGLAGCSCNRLERRYLEPPMARNPSWLPDAQCARRAAAGSVLSQIDMSFGDTPLLLNRRRRFFFTPVGETASCRGIALPNLTARRVYSVFTRRALEICRAPRPITSRKPMRQALSRERGPPIGLARLGRLFVRGGDGDGTTLHLTGIVLFY